ncbi:MAG TPA: hypothetical protein VHV83_20430 [Armatimonadota bacterium]|nr:hypothetical protein [Armatimonadota bacterium]
MIMLIVLAVVLLVTIMAFNEQKESSEPMNQVQLESIDTDQQIFLFPRSPHEVMHYHFRNTTAIPLPCRATFMLVDRHGNMLARQSNTATLTADKVTDVPFTFDTRNYRFGVYDVQCTLEIEQDGQFTTGIQRETSIAVRSDTTIGKAQPGEFRYGMDLGHPPAYRNMENWAWMKAMGVDILRREGNIKPLPEMIDFLHEQGIQAMSCVDIPSGDDPAKLKETFKALATAAEIKAAQTRNEFIYWELGNEPDMLEFFPGPIDDYLKGYDIVARAIKRGNPNAIVMNGGICYANPEANVRGHKFFEMVDPATLDAVAYHAHGPGDAAERTMHEKIQLTLEMYQKSGRPLIETESGMDARTKAQEEVQAATCIEKMVYAQSVKMPFFLWFRLCFEETNTYGMTRVPDDQPWWYAKEPRPSIMSYRAMVETLRDYTFSHTIDLGRDGLSCYAFSQNGGNGRVCVLWVNQKISYGVYLNACPNAASITNAQVLDMYGNPESAMVLPDGRLKVTAGEFPIFVKWDTTVPARRFLAMTTGDSRQVDTVVDKIGRGAGPLAINARQFCWDRCVR